MIQQSAHELDFDGIDLTGTVDYDGVTFHALAENSTMGNPVPVERSIESALRDGSFVVTDRYENREPSFQVQIEASDSVALARGEKMLFQSCARRVPFGWKPPDGFGERTVYEAHTSRLEWVFDDLDELRLRRAYNLTLVCHPWGFSESEVVDDLAEPAPVTPVTTTMVDGSSTSGWSSPGGAVTLVGGALNFLPHVTRAIPPDNGFNRWYHEGAGTYMFSAVDFTATPFVTADVWWDGPTYFLNPHNFQMYADNVLLPVVSRVNSPIGPGIKRITWRSNDPSVASLRLESQILSRNGSSTPPTIGLRIDNLTRSNVGPAQSPTGRQALRLADVSGSARTMASLEIGHASAALGDVLVYTSPHLAMGYAPNLRPFMVSGPSIGPTNTTTVSGVQSQASIHRFDVPASLMPDGTYYLLARARSVSGVASRTLQATVKTKMGAGEFAPVVLPQYSGIFDTTPWQMIELGTVALPTVKVARESGGVVAIELAASNLYIDEVWAFHLGEDSDLTWVKCGEGTPLIGERFSQLFIDSPSLTNDGIPGVFTGTTADRSDALDPGYPTVRSWGQHPATPPQFGAFVVTTGAQYPSIGLRHLPAWFGNAAPLTAGA